MMHSTPTDRKRISPRLRRLGLATARKVFYLLIDHAVDRLEYWKAEFTRLPQKARNYCRKIFHNEYRNAAAVERRKFKRIGCDYRLRGEYLRFSSALGYHGKRIEPKRAWA